MDRMECLSKIQHFKNAIEYYSGSDPLKPRYEYIMWLEQNMGKENSDVNVCLEQTLGKFQHDSRYVNDTRFVELLILFTRLKGDKLRYFKQLNECQLGVKCAMFYKAWSDEFIANRKFQEAFEVLQKGLNVNALPVEILKVAERDLMLFIANQILSGESSCDLLRRPCNCKQQSDIRIGEVQHVKNWEFNPLKPGEVDNFTCPFVVPDPPNPNKVPMYAKHLVYYDTGEYQLEEIKALRFRLKVLEKSETTPKAMGVETPATTPNPPGNSQQGDVSGGTQVLTVSTKNVFNLVQQMWKSPNPPDESHGQTVDSFKIPEVRRAAPITVYCNSSILGEQENVGISGGGSTTAKSGKKCGLSERKQPAEHMMVKGDENHAVKHQLMFGSSDSGRSSDIAGRARLQDDDLAVRLDPTPSSPQTNQGQHDWCLEDLTCNTKVFNNYIKMSSTPNMKLKEISNTPQQFNPRDAYSRGKPGNDTVLSVILEASKETPSSGSSNSENHRPSNTLDVEERMDSLDINLNDPFSAKFLENLLRKINFPHNFEPDIIKHCQFFNAKLPNITKTLKFDDNLYSLTGETFKGAYAKVLKVICNDENYALKIEKPSCHWEYYICKEIRRRLDPKNVRYFADINDAYMFQNGSILILDWAKYGTLLNVINQSKISCKTMEASAGLFFCIEVLNAVHYLHSQCNIIHADIKPDNFVVHSLPNLNSGPFVQLIDFGRSIDMKLMPKGHKFTCVVTTDGFQCNEMKENKPWTYQIDLYGLAGTMYCILVGDYMKVLKRKDAYVLARPLARQYQALWNPIFKELLNIESCDKLPDLNQIKQSLEISYNSMDPFTVKNSFKSLTNVLHGN